MVTNNRIYYEAMNNIPHHNSHRNSAIIRIGISHIVGHNCSTNYCCSDPTYFAA